MFIPSMNPLESEYKRKCERKTTERRKGTPLLFYLKTMSASTVSFRTD